MIVYEEFEDYSGIKMAEIRSDQHVIITCNGMYCDVAYDPVDQMQEWQETDMPCGTPIPDDTTAYAEAGRILMGVEE